MIRFKNWQWFNMPCRGRYVHRICILQEGDLPLLARRQELFANKFHDGYSSLALQCLAEKLYNRTRDQTLGTLPFNISYYQSVLQLGTVCVRPDAGHDSLQPQLLSVSVSRSPAAARFNKPGQVPHLTGLVRYRT